MKHGIKWVENILLCALLSIFFFVRLTICATMAPGILLGISVGMAVLISAFSWRTNLWEKWASPFANRWMNLGLLLLCWCVGYGIDPTISLLHEGMFVGHYWLVVIARIGGGGLLALLVLCVIRAFHMLSFPLKIKGSTFWIFLLGLNLAAAFYVAGSSTVYFWDNAGFFEMARTMSQQPMNAAFFSHIKQTVLLADYNQLLAFPISIVMRLLGTNRMVFVLTIVNLYLAPAYYISMAFLQKHVHHSRLCFFILVLLVPCTFYMAWNGFVDVAAMGIGLLAVLIWMNREQDTVSRGILCGILLVICFVLRRTFIFFVGGFGVATFFSSLIFDRKQLKGVLAMALVGILGSVVCMQPFVTEKLMGTDYGRMYTAYHFGILQDYFLFVRYFGIVALLGAAAGTVVLFISKPMRSRAAFLAIMVLACFLAFVRVQTHGQQHLLLYVPAMYGLILYVMRMWDEKRESSLKVLSTKETEESTWGSVVRAPKKEKVSFGHRMWFVGLGAAAFVTAFSPLIPREQPKTLSQIHTHAVLPTFSYQPPVRKDMSELIRLQDRLYSLSPTKPVTVGVVASSLIVNADMIRNTAWSANLWCNESATNTTICYLGDVDKRDGFSWGVLDADYLVVASPIQTHLRMENQRVIAYLAEDVLTGSGVGKAYTKLADTYTLEDGVSVYLYKRNRAVTWQEKKSLEKRFLSAYPDMASLFCLPG